MCTSNRNWTNDLTSGERKPYGTGFGNPAPMNDTLFKRIDQGRTADEVVRQIELLILEGILRVGERLPGERDLSRQFDVSRPILRSALKSLEARGLLKTRHGGGTVVADVIGQVFKEPIVEIVSRHRKATVDYLEFRREIDALAAEYAARRATPEDRALIVDIVRRMEAAHAKDDFDEEAEIDVELHNAIGESAHNMILLHTLRACYRLLTEGVFYNRAVVYGLPGARDKLLNQHLAIANAVLAGDPQAARQAAEAHMAFVEDAMRVVDQTDNRRRVSRLRMLRRSDNGGAEKEGAEKLD